ncbi:Mycothiol-dependent maleylpyruvate isomerase metal-binding domain-containing protein OS=Streptomyces fumanus OX=67302 GN=GCM10018772_26590 PE=4 SV=1 [Streptomyces fumanus]
MLARVLHRLFPDVPADCPPWPALLWATGHTIPRAARRTAWRWHGEPRDARDARGWTRRARSAGS